MQIIFNENLSRHNTMRVGGNADTLLLPESEDEMIRAYEETLEQKGRVFILGRGSNTIFRDDDFRGRIIKTTKACPRIKIVQSNRKSFRKRYLVEAGASVTNQSFLRFCRENNLAGPTYLQSVPGNIGGSIYMNAGTGIDE
ncbi:MAG: FAD-binding protein, partial [Gammaproteobacteria bacterium]|nr:FAD-binding protein [Gammaproteobacteria bacterium]